MAPPPEDLLKFALESANVGLWAWDIVTNVVTWSDNVEALFGLDEGEFAGTYDAYLDLLTPEEREKVQAEIDRCLSGAIERYSVEHSIRLKDGALRWIQGNARVFYDPEGKPIQMAGTVTDITERYERKAERERLQQQLVHSQKLESLGRLAGGIAHDFNNLLTAVLSYAEMATTAVGADTPVGGMLAEIQHAGERASKLTNHLLAFSRQQVVQTQDVNMAKLVANVTSLLRRAVGERIRLHVETPETCSVVWADPGQLEQVLVSLAINARDALPDGGSIWVSTHHRTLDDDLAAHHQLTPGEFVELTVRDNGSGMSSHAQQRAFEPFFTTKGLGQGTGLGLSTCHGIARQHGGAIWIESELGAGTSVTLALPRVVGREPTPQTKSPSMDLERGSETVLLVEDEPAVRKVAASAMTHLGYRVLSAASGSEALELAKVHKSEIRLLLCDMVLPEQIGTQVARSVLELIPELRVLFVSGYAADLLPDDQLPEDHEHFLHKPYSLQALATKLREVLA